MGRGVKGREERREARERRGRLGRVAAKARSGASLCKERRRRGKVFGEVR